ncbi:MAG: tyrosine-protein phosphatase [Bacteroidales bacterium]|nr:tyrosine-protein phosphatase [Candidatus Cacconaster caballi]
MEGLSDNFVRFDGIVNVRDLGGYPMADGSLIRKGMLLRGGGLYTASDEDIDRFENEYRFAYIFDFRTEGELNRAPDRPVRGAENVWLPAIDPYTEQLGKTCLPEYAYSDLLNYILEHRDDELVARTARNMYIEFVENEYTQLQYAAFVQMIASMKEDRPVFWHCSQGKDRTGMGAAYLLAILGADREVIVDDYGRSNIQYRKDLEQLRIRLEEVGGTEEQYDILSTYIGANVSNFCRTLDFIDKKYGSLYNYVTNMLIVSADEVSTLRSRLLIR